jgi:transposase
VRDLPSGGRAVVLCWWKRVWSCPQTLCEQKTWTERHPAIGPRATLTERARQWAFEQVGEHDAAVSTVAAQLGVAWWTVMDQVIDRGIPLVEDPARLAPVDVPGTKVAESAPVTAIGVDETAFLRATASYATTFATGIADLTPGLPEAARGGRGPLGHRAGRVARRPQRRVAGGGDDRVAGPVPLRHRAHRAAARRRPRT